MTENIHRDGYFVWKEEFRVNGVEGWLRGKLRMSPMVTIYYAEMSGREKLSSRNIGTLGRLAHLDNPCNTVYSADTCTSLTQKEYQTFFKKYMKVR